MLQLSLILCQSVYRAGYGTETALVILVVAVFLVMDKKWKSRVMLDLSAVFHTVVLAVNPTGSRQLSFSGIVEETPESS